MIHLGEIQIRNQDSLVETRKKILGLAGALQFDTVAATRLATATSELARALLRGSQTPTIRVDLVVGAGRQDLVLEFSDCDNGLETLRLASFFDQVSRDQTRRCLTVCKRFPNSNQDLSNFFIRGERERISRRSRSELMEELRNKNEQLEKYNASLEDLVAERTGQLQKANSKMQHDLDAAASYVRTLLPSSTKKSPFLDWRYVPSADLGGDTFGYHWIDADHFCLYLLDVTGHGLDSALLSVTVLNVLRSASLPNTDFRHPGQVLTALNEAFPMDRYGEKMFTIWYGVYHRNTSVITWSGGGHPDALLFESGGNQPICLKSQGPMIGMIPWPEFEESHHNLQLPARLYIYSDGVHEIHKPDGSLWSFEEFTAFMSQPAEANTSLLDLLLNHVRKLHGSDQLEDDFSIVEARF